MFYTPKNTVLGRFKRVNNEQKLSISSQVINNQCYT